MDVRGLIVWLHDRALDLLGVGEALLLLLFCVVAVVAVICLLVAALCALTGVDFWVLK